MSHLQRIRKSLEALKKKQQQDRLRTLWAEGYFDLAEVVVSFKESEEVHLNFCWSHLGEDNLPEYQFQGVECHSHTFWTNYPNMRATVSLEAFLVNCPASWRKQIRQQLDETHPLSIHMDKKFGADPRKHINQMCRLGWFGQMEKVSEGRYRSMYERGQKKASKAFKDHTCEGISVEWHKDHYDLVSENPQELYPYIGWPWY